jgi:hypothetical protein
MAIVHNAAKRKLRHGEIALGSGLHHLRSSAAPLLAAAGQHDYLFMDMEHGAFTEQEATQISIAALATGIAPIVRVCAGALDEATRPLIIARWASSCRMWIPGSRRSALPMRSITRPRATEAGAARRPFIAIGRRMCRRRRRRSRMKL